ncbi:MAG TPA: hypothetical protein VGY91_01005 [Chthoniobacterales bacterium]|jgi:hypothetical protein|nr:hypothetical protein [Chthoniobacterales bacterium]
MKKFILLGLAVLSLLALAPAETKASELRVYVGPGYPSYQPYYYDDNYYWRYHHYHHSRAYYWHRWHHHHYDSDYDRY